MSAPGPRRPLGGWRAIYSLVLVALALDILFLWELTERYR